MADLRRELAMSATPPTHDEIIALARRHALRYCRANAWARPHRDDIQQTIAAKLLEASDRFDASRGVAFAAYSRRAAEGAAVSAIAAATGVSRHMYRSGHRRPLALVSDSCVGDSGWTDPSARAECRESDAWIADALSTLPPRLGRLLAALREGESVQSLARRHRVSTSRVAAARDQACAELRRRLDRSGERISMGKNTACKASDPARPVPEAGDVLGGVDAGRLRALFDAAFAEAVAAPSRETVALCNDVVRLIRAIDALRLPRAAPRRDAVDQIEFTFDSRQLDSPVTRR